MKRLARQLQFRNESVLIKLKQLFPEKANVWLVVHDLEEMCGYLKRLYSPYQLEQMKVTKDAKASSSGAMPFSVMQLLEDAYGLKVGVLPKNVHFDKEELLERAVDKLTDVVNQLSYQQS